MLMPHNYRNYIIKYDPPPIPIRSCDWQFCHEDYDGAPNETGGPPADHRSGFAPTLEDAKCLIDEMIDDEELHTRNDLIGEIEAALRDTDDKTLALHYQSIFGMVAVPDANGFFRVVSP